VGKCGKLKFPRRDLAEAAMRKVPPTATGIVPTRAYWCGKCKAWHYTSYAGPQARP